MAAETKRAGRPHPQQKVRCPRCDSPDTKFCYYNNYSTTQPRYFCKNCKRYWTAGGTLRNVPVGGGLRKNKRAAKTINKLVAAPHTISSSPPLPPSSSSTLHQTASPSTASACNRISTIAASHASLNIPHENHHALPHSASVPSSSYFVFNPTIFEADDQATPRGSIPYQGANFTHQIAPPPPPPLPLQLGGFKQQGAPNTTSFAGAYYTGQAGQGRAPSESLQLAGFHHSGMDTGSTYTMANFVNVNDWQQISEGLFGGGGESNFFFMQPPHAAPQWADFESETR